ncbi:MAG: RNA polymerase sigma factor [Jatrophihabitantaceae bacterium]
MGTDRERFEELFRQHYGAVVRYAVRRVGPDAAHEIVSETFVTAWRRLDGARGLQSLAILLQIGGWSSTCAPLSGRQHSQRNKIGSGVRPAATAIAGLSGAR